MRRLLLATAAAMAVASPAMATDGSLYAGIEGGVLFPLDTKYDVTISGTQFSSPFTATTYRDGFRQNHKNGFDIDAILGYDFGMFRVEGELGYKHAGANWVSVDTTLQADTDYYLYYYSASDNNFNFSKKTAIWSAMANALADFNIDANTAFTVGAGIGGARAHMLGDSDSALAWQILAGVRTAITPNLDLGIKYRYFQTGNLHVNDRIVSSCDGTCVYDIDAKGKFRSHSVLASLIYNFASVAPPPPPPP